MKTKRKFAMYLVLMIGAVLLLPQNPAAFAGTTPVQGKQHQKEQLTGSQLYTFHCGKCHSERQAVERSDANWEVAMLHMRVRANLSPKEEEKVKAYLQSAN